MEWIAGLAVAAAVVWLMVKNRTFRYVVLGSVAALAAGGWAWYEKLQADERYAYTLIRPADVEVRDARLSTGPGGKITVTIKNNSAHPLSAIEATIRIFDCPKGQFNAVQCETIGQESVWFGTPVPAGQVRAGDRYLGRRHRTELDSP